MVSNVGPLRTMSYSMMSSVSYRGRTYVPVKPNQFGYTQFRYVAGFPAVNGQEGVSIDKVKILNTLIEQLVNLKQKNIEPITSSKNGNSDDHINALIEQYQGQIQAAAATAESLPYKPTMPQTGTVINLVA